MTDCRSLVDPNTDGFPELAQALHDAMVDLLGDDYDIDYPALAVELADTAFVTLRPRFAA